MILRPSDKGNPCRPVPYSLIDAAQTLRGRTFSLGRHP